MPKKIIERQTISNPQALEVLIREFGEEPELSIQRRTIEYLRASSKCSAEKAEKVLEELMSLDIPRDAAILLINLIPTEAVEARALLSPAHQSLDLEVLGKAVEILKKCLE